MKKSTLLLAAGLCFSMVGIAQVPFLQDFEGTNPPTGWSLTNTDGTGWTFGNAAAVSSSYFAPPDHTTFAVVNDDAIGASAPVADDWMNTVSITGVTAGAFLSYDYYFLGEPTQGDADATGPYEVLNVNISTDGGTTWNVLDAPAGVSTNAWATQHVDLSAYAGMNIMLGFEYNGNDTYMYGAAVDNISIAIPPNNSIQYTNIIPPTGDPASYVLAGSNKSISGVVTNLGLNAITSYMVKYTDGVTVWSDTKSANIASFATSSFTISTPYNVTLGNHPIKSWVELTGDADHTDDTLNTVLVGASFLPTHQLVIEEGTGCWCGFCPRGAVFMDSMKVVHPTDVSLIAVHDKTQGTDPMAITAYDNGIVSLNGFTGFPTIVVDRKELLDPSQIFDGYADRNSDFGFADLTLSAVITGNTMNVATTAKPAIDLNGTYKLALVITEDSVHSTTSTYAQHNYYTGNAYGPLSGAGHNWATSTNPVAASLMWYDHVARSITGSFTGTANSLPASMTAGTTYNYSFSNVAISSSWKQPKLTAILLLIDSTKGIILNSKSMTPTVSSGIVKNTTNINAVNVYPNPASSNFNVNVDLAVAQKTTVSLYNLVGQVISTKTYDFNAGENLINISADQLASGMYTLLISSQNGLYQTKVSVVK